jgi:lysine 2-monooxygenase
MAEPPKSEPLDLAVIGAGAAGAFVAHEMKIARPDWSIGLFERSDRIGGRLRSVSIEGIDHPIELGGMRFLSSHTRVADLVEGWGLATHAFDATGEPERSYLRGVVAAGADARDAGRGYELTDDQRGRTAVELAMSAFEQIVPGFQQLDHEGYVRRRAGGRLFGRPVTDWSIGEALQRILGDEARRFVNDAFGYDSGLRAFCAPDLVEFLFAGDDPRAEARTPDAGMERIPNELAGRFEAAGGVVELGHELASLEVVNGTLLLRFANAKTISAARIVLAMPLPALRLLASDASALRAPAFHEVFRSVEGFPAMKLYLWYESPWWRPAVPGIRTTTDLPLRKIFYFDGRAGSSSVMLAMYTDGRDVDPWIALHRETRAAQPAPPAMLAEVQQQLAEAHPEVADIPVPSGSALMYWGADPHEVGWHFWRAGVNSDAILERAPHPDPRLPIYLANEAFSRRQSWVEGALEAADATIQKLNGRPD